MDFKFWLEIVIILVLVFISGFFSASEIAIVALRKSRIRELAKKGDSRARFVEKLKNDPDDFFAIVQIGMTVTASAASALGGATAILVVKPLIETVPIPLISGAAETISITLVIIVISYIFLVLAELVPKSLAIRYSERIALMVGPATWWSLRALQIIINFLSWSTNLCLKAIGVSPDSRRDTAVTEEEVKIILAEGLKQGIFEPDEHKLIHSVFEFSDLVARNVMTSRTEMVAVEIIDSPEEILKVATMEPYSRLPVYEENLDNIRGILSVRDLLKVFGTGGLIILKDIMREPFFVPDSKKISEILRDMQRMKFHMAVVVDEFGGTAGIITLEDILEEIVGEIQDEHDKEEEDMVAQPDGSLVVKGFVDADLVCERFGIEPPEGEFESITGMLMEKLDRVLELGEIVEMAGLKFTVLDKKGHRVSHIKVEKLP
ncbi:MAG: hemolysin family protein [candidate division Zixibacteria bacterium]